jgi:hypothetical protein
MVISMMGCPLKKPPFSIGMLIMEEIVTAAGGM